LAALASTAIKMPPRFPLYRHQRRGELSESRKRPGACTVQDVPCSGWTINRPDRQKNTSKWSGAPHTGMDCSSWSVSGKEKRQICTPGILLLQRLASDLWINKYSFNMVFHDLFLLDQTGGLSGHADRRGSLLPSVMFWSDQGCAQLAAGRQGVVVRSLVAGHTAAGQNGSVICAAALPAAHPFTIAPTVRTEQGNLLPVQQSFTGGEHGLKLSFFQLFRSHGGAPEGKGRIRTDLLR